MCRSFILSLSPESLPLSPGHLPVPSPFFSHLFFPHFFETGSHLVAKAGLEFTL